MPIFFCVPQGTFLLSCYHLPLPLFSSFLSCPSVSRLSCSILHSLYRSFFLQNSVSTRKVLDFLKKAMAYFGQYAIPRSCPIFLWATLQLICPFLSHLKDAPLLPPAYGHLPCHPYPRYSTLLPFPICYPSRPFPQYPLSPLFLFATPYILFPFASPFAFISLLTHQLSIMGNSLHDIFGRG